MDNEPGKHMKNENKKTVQNQGNRAAQTNTTGNRMTPNNNTTSYAQGSELSGGTARSEASTKDTVQSTMDSARSKLESVTHGIGNTLSNVAERLSPKQLMSQVSDLPGMSFVAANPIPFLFVGAGLGWYFFGNRLMSFAGRGENRDVSNRNRVSSGTDTGLLDQAKDKLTQMTSTVRDSVGGLYSRGTKGVTSSPLLWGSGALGLGVLAGALIPSSGWENSMMGSHSDRIMGAAKNLVMENSKRVVDSVKNIASNVGIKTDALPESRI